MSLITVLIIGAISGMLVNYFSDVLPVSRHFDRPSCAHCGDKFSMIEYLTFQKCPACGQERSIRAFVVITFAVAFTLFLYYFPFSDLSLWASLPILIYLGSILVIDYEHRLVLYQTSIFGFVLFLLYGVVLHGLSAALVGGIVGLSIMLVFYFLGIGFSKVMGNLRHREIEEVAFGFGDVCLGTILGLLTGWPGIMGAFIISMIAFVAFSFIYLLILIILGKYRAFSNTLPFTFFLVFGAITIFYLSFIL